MNDDEKPPKSDKRPMEAATTPTNKKGSLDREVQAKIGQQLRSMYNDVLNEGVPDRFADLLSRLDKPNDTEPK
jgi:hypothetical protein